MIRIRRILIVLGGLIAPLSSQTAEDIFARANEQYRAGRFNEAVQSYEEVATQGWVSPSVFYNLGNAYYRMGRVGPAMLAYERALKLDPSDEDARHNLRLLSLRTIDRIEPLPELFIVEWIREFGTVVSPTSMNAVFAASWVVLFLSLGALYLTSSATFMRVFRIVVLAAFGVVVLSGASLLLYRWADTSEHTAIVMEQTVTVKSSPDNESVDAFVIHEGLKVRITDAVGEWVRIALPDGKVGWVLQTTAERI